MSPSGWVQVRGALPTRLIAGATGIKQNDSKIDANVPDESKGTAAQRIRHIGTKTFYWKNDEWQDYDNAVGAAIGGGASRYICCQSSRHNRFQRR